MPLALGTQAFKAKIHVQKQIAQTFNADTKKH